MKSLKHTSVVLVGLCNEDPLLQILLGTLVFRQGQEEQVEPQLIYVQLDSKVGLPSNPFKPRFDWKMKGCYGLSFPSFAGDHGVTLNLDKEKGIYHFTTGINHGGIGSSGPLCNGGPELVDVLDQLFDFVPTS